MSAFTATDEIRSRGVGVSLADCPNCAAARAMDDLSREQLRRIAAERDGAKNSEATVRRNRAHWILATGCLALVTFLLALSDLGFFKP